MGDVKSVVQWAMEIADNLPEQYQEAAFAELLRYALSSMPGAAEVDTVADTQAKPDLHPSEPWQKKLISELPKDYLVARKGTRDQQTAWAAIKLWEQGDEATSKTVRETIKTKLGVTPPSEDNTSNRLRQLTPKYLRREKRKKGRGYAYTPTAKALEAFEGLEEELEE
jgi:hypothetical protein